MTCNYIEYQKLMDKLFYGVLLTDEHLNNAAEQIRRYILEGGAAELMAELQIGLRLHIENDKIIRRRICFIGGENEGRELTIEEIRNLGFLFKGSRFYEDFIKNRKCKGECNK